MSIEQLAKAITDGMQLAFTQIRAESRTSGEVLIKEMAKQTQELTQALRSVTRAQPNIQVQLPKFTGQGDLATWLNEVEIKFAALGVISDQDKISWATTALEGIAQQLVLQTQLHDWNEAKKLLQEHFVPRNQSLILRKELQSLRQGSEGFNAYLFLFKTLAAKIAKTTLGDRPAELGEVEKLNYFLNGLNARTAQAVLVKNPTTFDEAVKLALVQEQVYNPAFMTANSSSLSTSTSRGIHRSTTVEELAKQVEQLKLSSIQQPQHEEDAPSAEEEALDAIFKPRRKYNFRQKSTRPQGRYGKPSTRRWTPKGQNHQSNSPDNNYYQNNGESNNSRNSNVKCFRCGNVGHLANECRTGFKKVQLYKAKQLGNVQGQTGRGPR